MQKLNATELKILSTLLFSPKARFKDMNRNSMSSDKFSYHVRQLLGLGLIKKDGQNYSLTQKGKMEAGKIDTSIHKIEKQPKVSVIVIPYKIKDGGTELLVQQRIKEPYFGYWGFITGKVKFGETIFETAARELKEETGFVGEGEFCYELHEMVYDKNTNELLEDKFFHVIKSKITSGKLRNTKEGKNKFVPESEFKAIAPKFHSEQQILDWALANNNSFKEEKYFIEEF